MPNIMKATVGSLGRKTALACLVICGALGWFGADAARAGLGPENVAVVVNEDSWASLALANEYVALRHIPPLNVIYLRDLGDYEGTDVEAFRDRILKPALTELEKRGLAGQIDCIAYSSDIPYAIDIRGDFPNKQPPKMVGDFASLNGLTYLYAFVLAKQTAYGSLNANFYMRRPLAALKNINLDNAQKEKFAQAQNLMGQKKWAEAAAILEELDKAHPNCPDIEVCLAGCLANTNKPAEAVQLLKKAVAAGWADWRMMQRGEFFKELQDREDFLAVFETMKNVATDIQPTRGFRNVYIWSPEGEVIQQNAGARYLLSTVLGWTSGRGNSLKQNIEALRRSTRADGTRPQGTFYFMRNQDIRSRTRDGLFSAATEAIKKLGLKAEILDGVLPRDKPDVAGTVVGAQLFNWSHSGSVILPGAICENLTSYNGVLREGCDHTSLTEWNLYGAAGTSGPVTEPYAIPQKFPSPFIQLHYARGCSLAEAFYQSVWGPYQLLIIGDPLCAPWAKRPEVTVEGISNGEKVKDKITLRPGVKGASGAAVKQFEFFVDGRRRAISEPGKPVEWDTAQFEDGAHELRVVAVSADPVETPGRLIVPFQTTKGGHEITVTPPEKKTVLWNRPFTLSASCAGAKAIVFLHNGRILATIQGEKGAGEIDPAKLGLGPVRLQTGALLGGEPPVRVLGPEIELTVAPTAPMAAMKAAPAPTEEKGILLTREGETATVVKSTARDKWLSEAGVKEGQKFTLSGIFEAAEDDVYQFQVRGNVPVALFVDAKGISTPEPARAEGQTVEQWRFLPVPLAKGAHFLRVTGTGQKESRLQLRFGGPGALSVGEQFRPPAHGARAASKPAKGPANTKS